MLLKEEFGVDRNQEITLEVIMRSCNLEIFFSSSLVNHRCALVHFRCFFTASIGVFGRNLHECQNHMVVA
jgi:hypothetical protein